MFYVRNQTSKDKNDFMNTYPMQTRSVFTFRRFRRTGWALFAALGREVRIGVLTFGTLVSAAPRLEASAARFHSHQDGEEVEAGDTVPLPEAAVSASRVPMTAGMAARQVTTLTREDIAAAGVTAVSDVLKLAAAVDVRQRAGFGIQQDISIDGGSFDQVVLLINGVPFGNPQTGHNAAQFPFTLADLERVEVIEGAASRLFGSQAFGGAINFVTKQAESSEKIDNVGQIDNVGKIKNAGQIDLKIGSYGTFLASARHAVSLNPRWYTSLSAGARRGDGAVDNGDFKGANLFWQGVYEDKTMRLHAQAAHVADDFGANTFYSPANNRQWEATRRTQAAVSARTKGAICLAPTLSWTRSTDHYQWIRGTHTAENFNRTDVFNLGFNAYGSWRLGRTAIGAELRDEHLLSGNLGMPMPENQWVRIPGQNGLQYTRSAHRTNLDLYAEHNWISRRWTLSFGLLAMRNSALDQRFRLFPGVDVAFRPARGLRLFASWNRSLRLPTFTELWYKSPSQEGNTGLRPERNSQWRVGMEWERDAFVLTAKAHLGRGSGLIDWVMYSPEDVYHAAAFRLHSVGFALRAVADFRRFFGENQPLGRLVVSYAYLNQRRKDDAAIFRSNYAMNYLRHKLIVTVEHDMPFGLTARWSMRLQHRMGAYQIYENFRPTDRLKPYGNDFLIDFHVQREWGRVVLTCDLQNLTARRYVDIAGVPQPGLFMLCGATVRW